MAIVISSSFAVPITRSFPTSVTIMVVDIDQNFPDVDKCALSLPGDENFYCPPVAITSLCMRQFDTGYVLSLRNAVNLRWLKFESLETVRNVQASLPPSIEHLIFSFCHFWQIPVLHSTSPTYRSLLIRQRDDSIGQVRETTRKMPVKLDVLSALRSDGALISRGIPYRDGDLELAWL